MMMPLSSARLALALVVGLCLLGAAAGGLDDGAVVHACSRDLGCVVLRPRTDDDGAGGLELTGGGGGGGANAAGQGPRSVEVESFGIRLGDPDLIPQVNHVIDLSQGLEARCLTLSAGECAMVRQFADRWHGAIERAAADPATATAATAAAAAASAAAAAAADVHGDDGSGACSGDGKYTRWWWRWRVAVGVFTSKEG